MLSSSQSFIEHLIQCEKPLGTVSVMVLTSAVQARVGCVCLTQDVYTQGQTKMIQKNKLTAIK